MQVGNQRRLPAKFYNLKNQMETQQKNSAPVKESGASCDNGNLITSTCKNQMTKKYILTAALITLLALLFFFAWESSSQSSRKNQTTTGGTAQITESPVTQELTKEEKLKAVTEAMALNSSLLSILKLQDQPLAQKQLEAAEKQLSEVNNKLEVARANRVRLQQLETDLINGKNLDLSTLEAQNNSNT